LHQRVKFLAHAALKGFHLVPRRVKLNEVSDWGEQSIHEEEISEQWKRVVEKRSLLRDN
jgi:hypothetical protein